MLKADALLALVRRAFATPIPRSIPHPPSAKLVLVCLSMHADPQGQQAYPSRDRLAALCEVSPRTIDRVLRDLCTHGLIAEQAAPTFTRPRVWQLPDHSCPIDLLPFDLPDSQIERTGTDTCPSKSHRLATDQIQIQEQEQIRERAPADAGPSLLDLRATADANYRVVLKVAHTVLDVVGVRASLGEVVEAVKERCARAHIVYWPGDVVHRAVAAAFVQRVGRPQDPVAIRELRRVRRGRFA